MLKDDTQEMNFFFECPECGKILPLDKLAEGSQGGICCYCLNGRRKLLPNKGESMNCTIKCTHTCDFNTASFCYNTSAKIHFAYQFDDEKKFDPKDRVVTTDMECKLELGAK